MEVSSPVVRVRIPLSVVVAILSIVATCIAHNVDPRASPHKFVHFIVHGWPRDRLRDLLPDRMLGTRPELYVGQPDALPLPASAPALRR